MVPFNVRRAPQHHPVPTTRQGDEVLPRRKLSLNEVPSDIHHLIIAELMKSSWSAVRALGQSTRTLRQATLPFISRNLILKRAPNESCMFKVYQALVETFRQDSGCEIAQFVRNITVKDEIPEEDLLSILDKVSKCGTLKTLRWETTAHMPATVLDKLSTTWPGLELSVRVLDREKAPITLHRQMDVKLLSSPLLKQLAYNVYFQGGHPEQAARSEWPKLTKALVEGGNVRVLQIEGRPDQSQYRSDKIIGNDEPENIMRLNLKPGSRLPPLDELTIHIDSYWCPLPYPWDVKHCQLFHEAMNISRLRKLDFGSDQPDVFFSAFRGLLPGLKALRFGILQNGSISVAERFIRSIKCLEKLDIDKAQLAIDALWPAIMKCKGHLKELILRPTTVGYCVPQYIELERLQTLSIQFPVLERLGWDAPFENNVNPLNVLRMRLRQRRHYVDPKHLAVIRSMNLRRLDLFLHLPGKETIYAAKLEQDAMGNIPPPPLERAGSRIATISIMETISNAQERPLESLTLHFARTGYEDRAQPYMMHTKMHLRRSKDESAEGDSKYEARGTQSWYGGSKLEEEILFDE